MKYEIIDAMEAKLEHEHRYGLWAAGKYPPDGIRLWNTAIAFAREMPSDATPGMWRGFAARMALRGVDYRAVQHLVLDVVEAHR